MGRVEPNDEGLGLKQGTSGAISQTGHQTDGIIDSTLLTERYM